MLTTQKGQKIAPETLLLWRSHTHQIAKVGPTEIPGRCPSARNCIPPGVVSSNHDIPNFNQPESIQINDMTWYNGMQQEMTTEQTTSLICCEQRLNTQDSPELARTAQLTSHRSQRTEYIAWP